MTCAELANADTARYTCAQFIGIIDRSRRKPGILRQKLDYDPSKRLVVASYSADLAIKHGNDFRTVINSAEYHGIFPSMRVSPMKNTQTEVVTTLNGFRLGISLDGTLTGRGGDITIIDDPIAALAALSQKGREHVANLYFNTVLSRLDDKQNGPIVLVMQRLHEDDLAGVLYAGPMSGPC